MFSEVCSFIMYLLVFSFTLFFSNNIALCQGGGYDFSISTMEVVDRDGDGQKEGLEIFYILRHGDENIILTPEDISQLEAYLYEKGEDEILISYWRIDELEGIIFNSIIYLPFREGFAYNVYIDKIVPAVLKIKIIFRGDTELQAEIRDRLSFLSY